ncbi:MAG: Prevent-host-death protein [Azospira oryzae]|nr:MAG: Prevent-host-death protein [Azospira oryzae]PZP82553.1 MAG: Prevent-host-death protein [Azospira oryzae]
MSGIKKSGVEAARKNLSALLEQAYRGEPSLITRHGKVYAAIVPPSFLSVPGGSICVPCGGRARGSGADRSDA